MWIKIMLKLSVPLKLCFTISFSDDILVIVPVNFHVIDKST